MTDFQCHAATFVPCIVFFGLIRLMNYCIQFVILQKNTRSLTFSLKSFAYYFDVDVFILRIHVMRQTGTSWNKLVC